MPEPVLRPRRRLPIPPPTPKPKTPLLPTIPPAPPALPPEALPPPEAIERPELALVAPTETTAPPAGRQIKLPARLARLPKPALFGGGAAVILIILALAFFAVLRIAPAISSIALGPTATPTRPVSTSTPTPAPGTAATRIPTIEATAPPFTAVAIIPTATPTVNRTVVTGAVAALNLAIAATQPVTVQVGVDGVMVHNGPIAAGDTQSWSAKEALYVRVVNFMGATVTFNTRKQVPLNFGERSVFERQWVVNSAGKVVAATPQPPGTTRTASPPLPTTPSPTASPLAPTVTRTPVTPTATRTLAPPTATRTPIVPTATKTPY